MNSDELAYWKKRDRIIESDFVWLAQRHIAEAIESLTERGYDKDSHAITELKSIQDRLAKLAVTVQTGLEEETDAEHDLDVNMIRNAGAL